MLLVDTYKTRAITGINAICYDGTNGDEIRALSGDGNVIESAGEFQVHLSDGRWQSLYPGWWIVLSPEDKRNVWSSSVFTDWLERE